jgi:hypothetical protein
MFKFQRLAAKAVITTTIAIQGAVKFSKCDDLDTTVQLGNIWDTNWDMREDSKSKVLHQIVMIRHGQYVAGDKDSDRVLTALGRQQAETTGKRLNALLSSGQISPISTMYFSTMQRATETCQIILPNIKVITDNDKAFEARQRPFTVEPCSMIREGAVVYICSCILCISVSV